MLLRNVVLCVAVGTAALSALPAGAADVKTAPLQGADGATHGTVTVTGAPKGVLLRIEATGLPPGWHGAHFHEKGDCVAPRLHQRRRPCACGHAGGAWTAQPAGQ